MLSDASLKESSPKYLKEGREFIIRFRSSSRGVAQMASLGLCSLKFWAVLPPPSLALPLALFCRRLCLRAGEDDRRLLPMPVLLAWHQHWIKGTS